MRLRLLCVALLLMLPLGARAVPFWMHFAKGVTLFSAPLTNNGLTAADPASSWPVTGVAAPTVAWWGSDELGAGTATTGTWTLTGTDADQTTPFCPDGSHSDITSGCMTAQRLGGSNDYYTSVANPGPGSVSSADFTVCAVVRPGPDLATTGRVADQREGAVGEGWSLILDRASTRCAFAVENHAGTTAFPLYSAADPTSEGWLILCGSLDYSDGAAGAKVYVNGRVGETTDASPGGTIAPATQMIIGADATAGNDLPGDIAAVFFWNSLLDSTDMAELYEYFVGILDEEGAPVAFTNTGPNCCWIDGAIECFSDDWPMLGCELPPGVAAGAGNPSSGFYSGEALTNSAVYSRDLGTGWTESGSAVACGNSATPFRDGRTTCTITDNHGGAEENIYQLIAHGLSNGEKAQICIYAYSASGTETMDVRVREQDGACGGGATSYEFAAVTATTSWKQFEFTHTVTDATCTNLRLWVAPYDFASGAAATGGPVNVIAQLFLDQNWCPPTYTETAAAAVGAGDDALVYDISGVAGLTTIADGTHVVFDYAASQSTFVSSTDAINIDDNATPNDYYHLVTNTSKLWRSYARSQEEGAARYIYSATGAWVFVEGTYENIDFMINHAGGATLTVDGVNQSGTSTALGAPPGDLDDLGVGCDTTGVAQPNMWISNVEVTQ